MTELAYGPLVVDIEGTVLSALDRNRLCDRRVGGVILFSRNYVSREQLTLLCADIHGLRQPPLLIAVDHEGGRVQRFRDGFTRLPAMNQLGEWWARDRKAALSAAEGIGYVLAAELRACGVDFSFTPVLDLDWGRSGVIGNRSFHRDPAVVSALATALIEGLKRAGMAACGKHFPGHGWVEADSHTAIPVDERPLAQLEQDMVPYLAVGLDAVMPAHVIYPEVDDRPAGFSPVWNSILRNQIGFDGLVFSDDLSMEGAAVAGDIVARAQSAWIAGCDMLLVCNAPDSVERLLEVWNPEEDKSRSARIARVFPVAKAISWKTLKLDMHYRDAQAAIQLMEKEVTQQ